MEHPMNAPADLTTTTGDALAALVRGAGDLEPTARGLLPHRLPAWARAQCPDGQLALVEAQPSGVRVAFATTATRVELEAVPTKRVYAGAPPRPDGVYDLVVDGVPAGRGSVPGGDVMTVDLMTGAAAVEPGPSGTVCWSDLPGATKHVEVWLPHDERTELVALRTDAPVVPLPDHARRTWVHHGSSISQGSGAATPTGTWPAVAAALGGVDLVNVGLGGSALLDPFVGRVLRDTPADLLSLKLGINVVNTDLMRRRAFGPAVHGLLDTIREGHPDTPLLLVSPVLCPIHETTPGPSVPDPEALAAGSLAFSAAGDPAEVAAGKLTLAVVRDELATVVAQRADDHLVLLDGRDLYGEADHERLPLPDRLHPDAATHRLIGERFAAYAFADAGPFAAG
ncbi:GDSL-type esterase/lipase family protein [Nocardioides rubriscoriae]|uniref:GDSL-type esterase/lipase family protein n=1 Tax=Nocardioides rubriscoriae TaxID=642762 RepID=UPI001B860BE1|nr:GDSL-type esterase/lipase family protein [Nocardioides rubriscoriae]